MAVHTHLTAIFQYNQISQYQNVSILDFTGAKDDGGGGDNCSSNIQLFTGQMPFLSPIQQCQSTEGKINWIDNVTKWTGLIMEGAIRPSGSREECP